MEQQQYKYYAFISYSSQDTEWGRRVQRKLEHYRMPATLCSEHGWERTPIKPVFFAPTDIQPGGLTEEIQERLRQSRNLIVICSPRSAQSVWVGKEIEFFHQLGRTKQIHFFIVDGQPHSGDKETECFNPVVEALGIPEILGANIHERNYRWAWMNKERAYVQLISKLLGVEFDAIWQRHRRLLIQRVLMWTIGILALSIGWGYTIKASMPFAVELTVHDTALNRHLPASKGGTVTLYLDDEVLTDTLRSLSDKSIFNRIPHKYLDKTVRMTVACEDYVTADTMLPLARNMSLDIHRHPDVYGHVKFQLLNRGTAQPVAHADVTIADSAGNQYFAKSDAQGMVEVHIPLDKQRRVYNVQASVPLEKDEIIMPCGEDDLILTK